MGNRSGPPRKDDPPLADVLIDYSVHPEFERQSPLDANAKGVDDFLLNLAVRRGVLAHVRVLIDNGANINCQGDMGFTALHDAVSARHELIADYLLTHGANPLIRNEFGDTPLEMAIKGGQVQMAKLIRRHLRR